MLDTQVFGKIAGINAGKYAKRAKKSKKLNLKHVENYINELKKAKIKEERRAPLLLPDYREKNVLSRAIDIL
ncbi:MAG TPA: hypothetical protein ENI52_04415 [Thermoplasmata archaeon]|nr:hypothetical protein [Thermoplasmata archaeon]